MLLKKLSILFICIGCTANADILLTPNVSGVQEPAQNNITSTLNVAIQDLPQPIEASQAQNFYDYSHDTVYDSIAPFGYFQPKIQKNLIKAGEKWQLNYNIMPGPKTHLIAIDFHITGEGAKEPGLQTLTPPFHIGDVFLSENYENFKTHLIDEANALGYIKANFSRHEVLINRKKNTAIIYLTLDTGPRYYFGDLSFSPSPLNRKFLNRFVPFKQGETYSSSKLYQLQTDLTNSNYFKSVSALPNLNADDPQHQIPVNVKLKMRPRQEYILGAGYGTDTGPRATLGSNWNYVNQYGDRFNTLLRISQVQSTALAKYIFPGSHPLTDQYNLNASIQTNSINQGSSNLKQVGAGYTLSRGFWQRNFNLSYQVERFSFFDNPYQISHLLLPGIGTQYLKSNDPLFPTEGYRFNVNLIAAKEGVLSDTNLAQTKVSTKWIHSFTPKQMILLRGDFGYTAVHDLNKLPLSLSFFTGGAQSVRGYSYNAMGPGRYLLVGSAEYRYRVKENWYAATFFDMGNAFNNFPTARHATWQSRIDAYYQLLERGAGVGVVWKSPVGPMELTLAKAMTTPGHPNRVQFNMGADL
jgi:translocation and assembly module TamA